MPADQREQGSLALLTLGADLSEAGRDHADGLDALVQGGLHCLEDRDCRQADHDEIHAVRDLGDGGIPADTRYRLAVAIDRIRRPRVFALDDVPEQFASDRSSPRGRPEDRDRPSFEEGAQRRDDTGVVSCLHVGGVLRGNGDREGHLHLAALESPRDLEPDTLEDADHRRVVGHHLADESFDSTWTCERRQSFQHPGCNSSTLVVVGDGKGDLGAPRIAQPHVVRQGDDAVHAVLGHRCE